jgi:glutaminyl-peptide cyclotransferase
MRRLIACLLPLMLLGAAPRGDAETLPVARPVVVATYPHDRGAFTEGLLYRDGLLYESTGLEGRSVIRAVRLEDGTVVREARLADSLFGEGLVDWKDRLVSVTWRTGIGFVWDRSTFKRLRSFRYAGEGWGLTQDGRHIIMSDGSPVLRFLDPETLKLSRRLTVTAAGAPVRDINELEWVRGEIWANIWQTDMIARIDPANGRVIGWIDIAALSAVSGRRRADDVANGIAWDKAKDRLFVTGKNWGRLFEIRLPELPNRGRPAAPRSAPARSRP